MRTTRRNRREARRLLGVCLADGRLDEGRARKVVRRVAAGGRRGRLAVLSHFHRLVGLQLARHRAVVESAAPLPDDVRAGVEARLARAYGPGVSTTFLENPALIAGMRVQVGSDVYDGSVRRALATLEERFR